MTKKYEIVPLDLSLEEIGKMAILAHDRDMTLNAWIVEAIERYIDEVNANTYECDKCKFRTTDTFEKQEFLCWEDTAGYGNSVFGDMTKMSLKLCQNCVKEVLGPYIRTKEADF